MESFRLFPHRDTEVCRKFVCQVRKVHRPFQRTLAEKAGYFYPVVVISFPDSSASYEGGKSSPYFSSGGRHHAADTAFCPDRRAPFDGHAAVQLASAVGNLSQEAPGSLCAACAHRRVLLSLLRLRADAAFQGLLQKGRARCDYHDIPHGRLSDESGRPR